MSSRPISAFGLRPSRDLAAYVAGYDIIETDDAVATTPGIALPEHALVVSYGGAANVEIGGARWQMPAVSVRAVIPSPWSVGGARLGFFFVRLAPPTLYHLVRGSVAELTGLAVDASSLGLDAPSWVAEALAESRPGARFKVRIVERWLRRLFADLPRDAPSVVRVPPGGLAALERHLAASPYSARQVRRDFLSYVGVSPKRFHDIVRVATACERLGRDGHGSLSDLALALDFYDQAHFNHTFKRYAGMSPTDFEKRLRAGPVGAFAAG